MQAKCESAGGDKELRNPRRLHLIRTPLHNGTPQSRGVPSVYCKSKTLFCASDRFYVTASLLKVANLFELQIGPLDGMFDVLIYGMGRGIMYFGECMKPAGVYRQLERAAYGRLSAAFRSVHDASSPCI